jgi:hypothetical protein
MQLGLGNNSVRTTRKKRDELLGRWLARDLGGEGIIKLALGIL